MAAASVPVNLPALVASQERISQVNRNDAAPERTELSRSLLARQPEGADATPMQPYTYQAPSSLNVSYLEAVEGRSFPKGIQDAVAVAVCDVQMGLFPELSRAWIVVDNRLFLWNYYRNDYNVFAELDQLIISVGLARPKPAAFAPSVPDYVLVVTTLVEVVLVRVDVVNGLAGLELRHAQVSAVTDGVPMRTVKGTEDGRIFLGGHDGALYELVYEAPSLLHSLGIKRQCLCVGRSGGSLANTVGWLVPSSLVKMLPRVVGGGMDPLCAVEVDARRKLLYTLSKAGCLVGYNIANGAMESFARIDKISTALRSFVESERNKSAALGVQKHDLVDVEAVALDVHPTSFIHLIVTTTRGVRVFFTSSDGPAAASARTSGKSLKVVCVRGPPQKERLGEVRAKQVLAPSAQTAPALIPAGPSTGAPVTRASKSLPGLCVLTFSPADGAAGGAGPRALKETIMALSVDLQMQAPQASSLKWQAEPFHEAVEVEVLGNEATGHAWAVCEETHDPSASREDRDLLARVNASVEAEGQLSELVLQHFAPRRRVLLLTSTGLWVLVKNRPVNQLYGLLGGPDQGTETALHAMFKRFGLDEACAMALAIACSAEGSKASQRAGLWLLKDGFGEQGRRLPALATDLARFGGASSSSFGGASAWGDRAAPSLAPSAASASSALAPSSLRGTVLAAPAPTSASGAGADGPEVVFSGCAEGLVLRVARLLRPFWEHALTDAAGAFKLGASELQRLRGPVALLAQFMHNQAPFRDAVQASLASRRLEELQQTRSVALVVGRSASAAEAALVVNVYSLVAQTVQALSLFVELQADGRVWAGVKLDAAEKAQLGKLTWADVVVSPEGRSACRALVRAAVEAGMDETAVGRLQDEAPDFFSDGDALQVVARRELLAAKAQTGAQRAAHVAKAVQILVASFERSLAGPKPYAWRADAALERLEEACARLAELDAHSEGIALCLELASRCARGPVSQLPASDDFEADESLRWRRRCYDAAFGLLGALTGAARDKALRAGLASPDALWHYALYKWLLANAGGSGGAAASLSRLETPYIEDFLRNPAACTVGAAARHDGENMDLYATWLQARGRYAEATKVLLDLARLEVAPDVSRSPSVDDRLGYLGRALLIASANVEAQRFTREVQDELDMCELQAEVGRAYLANPALATEQARVALQRGLVRPSRLYNDYAARGELWAECVQIMRACGFDEDPGELRRLYDTMLAPAVRTWSETQLAATVRQLASRFYEKNRESFAFPVDYIVASLEEAAFVREKTAVDERIARGSSSRETVLARQRWSTEWLPRALVDGGLPAWRVFVSYARLHAQVEGRRALYACSALQYVCALWLEQPGDAAEFDRFVNSALPLSLELGGAADVLERAVFGLQGAAADVSRQEAQAQADGLRAVLDRLRAEAKAR